MPDLRRASCRQCHRHRSKAGAISWGGLCVDCAKANVHANLDGIMGKSGPALHRWRRAVAASVGAQLVDDPPGRR